MPIYEYGCPSCGYEFEVLVRTKKDLPKTCPQCGRGKPVKAFSTFAVSSAPSKESPAACRACPAAGRTCAAEGCCGGDD